MCQGFRILVEFPVPCTRGFTMYLKHNIPPTIPLPPSHTRLEHLQSVRKSCAWGSIPAWGCGQRNRVDTLKAAQSYSHPFLRLSEHPTGDTSSPAPSLPSPAIACLHKPTPPQPVTPFFTVSPNPPSNQVFLEEEKAGGAESGTASEGLMQTRPEIFRKQGKLSQKKKLETHVYNV